MIEASEKVIVTEDHLPQNLNLLPNSLKRKTPSVFQAAYLAAQKIIDERNKKPQAIICVSALGCLNETISFLDKLDETDFGSPKDFVYSVHNSLGAMLAKEFEIFGPNLTLMSKSLSDAKTVADLFEEKDVLIVEFYDSNDFAKKVLQKCGINSFDTKAYASAFIYSK